MCGPMGSMFGLGLSMFAVFFLALLAILISHDYPYVGEWFEAKAEPGHEAVPLHEQRDAAVSSLWAAVGIYTALGVISGVAVCTHKVRASPTLSRFVSNIFRPRRRRGGGAPLQLQLSFPALLSKRNAPHKTA